ncbi:MAG: 2OG-Fe(II) oxygenase [Flavobacteriaceae bacterium]|nr:2OG-Fe(II) oxygenase [Flavobacteriaceae bacterium]
MNIYSDDEWLLWIDSLSEKDYVVIDQFLPNDLYNLVQHFFKRKLSHDDFKKSGIGSVYNNQIIESIRGDFTFWIDKIRDVEINQFFDLIEEAKDKLNRYCYLSLSGYEFHLAHYPKGSFYKRHLDQFNNRSNRMITMIVYLNENWKKEDGGELKIYKNDTEILIEPLANRCILFKSALLEHEVLPTNIGRNSLTGWFLYQPSSVGYILGNN